MQTAKPTVTTDLGSEGREIVRSLDLLPLLSKHGKARIVGSVALGLVVKRDVDVHLLVRGNDLFSIADDVYHALLDQAEVKHVRISDYRAKGGLKVAIDSFPAR